jgi:hypothetical protein
VESYNEPEIHSYLFSLHVQCSRWRNEIDLFVLSLNVFILWDIAPHSQQCPGHLLHAGFLLWGDAFFRNVWGIFIHTSVRTSDPYTVTWMSTLYWTFSKQIGYCWQSYCFKIFGINCKSRDWNNMTLRWLGPRPTRLNTSALCFMECSLKRMILRRNEVAITGWDQWPEFCSRVWIEQHASGDGLAEWRVRRPWTTQCLAAGPTSHKRSGGDAR